MWKSVSCEVQGSGHIRTGTPCQDKTLTVVLNGVNIIALADGAGSANLSHLGAECVVRIISEYFSSNFIMLFENDDGNQVKQMILETIMISLKKLAVEQDCKASDLASTLLAVAVFEEKYLIVHIGDGVIGYLDGEELKIASLPDNGEFSNETTFVTSSEALSSMQLFKGIINNIAGFVIMSDGTEQSLFHKPSKSLAKAIVKLMHRTCLLDQTAIKNQLSATFQSIIAKNTPDDCSIAILVRPTGILRNYYDLNLSEKCDILGLCLTKSNIQKRILWFDIVMRYLYVPRDIQSISRHTHIKCTYAKKRLEKLILCGLVVKRNSSYVKSN